MGGIELARPRPMRTKAESRKAHLGSDAATQWLCDCSASHLCFETEVLE